MHQNNMDKKNMHQNDNSKISFKNNLSNDNIFG